MIRKQICNNIEEDSSNIENFTNLFDIFFEFNKIPKKDKRNEDARDDLAKSRILPLQPQTLILPHKKSDIEKRLLFSTQVVNELVKRQKTKAKQNTQKILNILECQQSNKTNVHNKRLSLSRMRNGRENSFLATTTQRAYK